jgi:hypothetical protein
MGRGPLRAEEVLPLRRSTVAEKKENTAAKNRRAKSTQERQRDRHLKLVKEKCKEETDLHFTPPRPIADIEVPDGFRGVSISQALMMFAKPLMDNAGDCDFKGFSEIFVISILIWNYEILERVGLNRVREIKKKIITAMKGILGLKVAESEELLQKMLDRKGNLFPADIQPDHPIMFMRKELSHPIVSFNYDGLKYSLEPIPPDEHDYAAI